MYNLVFWHNICSEKCSFLTLEPAVIQFVLCHLVQCGKTALHHAARFGDKQMVQTLLKGDADVNATDEVGNWLRLP